MTATLVAITAVPRELVRLCTTMADREKMAWVMPVSYTHLDVYKRQIQIW